MSNCFERAYTLKVLGFCIFLSVTICAPTLGVGAPASRLLATGTLNPVRDAEPADAARAKQGCLQRYDEGHLRAKLPDGWQANGGDLLFKRYALAKATADQNASAPLHEHAPDQKREWNEKSHCP